MKTISKLLLYSMLISLVLSMVPSKKFLESKKLSPISFLTEEDIISPSEDTPTNETSSEDKPSDDTPTNENTPEDKPSEETPTNDTTPEDKPSEDTPSSGSSSNDEDETKIINIKCLWVTAKNAYSLQKLQNKENDYEKEFEDGKLILNFCQNTNTQIDNKESNSTVLLKNNENIIRLSGSIDGEDENKNVWSELSDDNKTGIVIRLVEGDYCTEYEKHQTTLKIYCDEEGDNNFLDSLKYTMVTNDTCKHIITAKSVYGCSLVSTYLLKQLVNEYNILFAIIFVILGIPLCLVGYRYITITIMLIASIVGCYLITLFVLSSFPSLVTSETKLWILIVVGLLLGCGIGYFMRGEIKSDVMLCGAFLGYSCATFVYQIVQNYISWDPTYLYYGTVGVCIVVGAIIGFCMVKPIIILGTSCLGGYLIMRGASLILGNYLDENAIIDLIKNQEYEQLVQIRNNWVYGYLGSWLILTVGGTIYQCIKSGKKKEKTDKE